MTPTRRLGFTLIELLAVIAVIAIIAAILFPVFAHVRERARQATCASNLRQIGMATMQYVADNDETMFPRLYSDAAGGLVEWSMYVPPSGVNQNLDKSRGMLGPYLKGDAVWVCPSTDTDWPGTRDGDPFPTYGLNTVLSASRLHPARNLAQVEMPSETILAADSERHYLTHTRIGLLASPFISPPSRRRPAVCGRHSGLANVLWLDGHVTARKPATAYLAKDWIDVATQERLHLGDIMRGPYTGDAQADDYYYELVKPAGR